MSFEKINVKLPQKSKILRQIKVILSLAKIGGYDDEGKIKDDYGNFIPNSDIATLLNYAMTPGRVMIGQDHFIKLLKKANVSPDLIINDNIRAKLINEPTNEQIKETIKEPIIQQQPEPIIQQQPEPIIQSIIQSEPQDRPSRKRKMYDNYEQPSKKVYIKPNWEIPD